MSEAENELALSLGISLEIVFDQPIVEMWLGRTDAKGEFLGAALSLVFSSGMFLDPGYYVDLAPPLVGRVATVSLGLNVSNSNQGNRLLSQCINRVGIAEEAKQVVFELSSKELFWCETGNDGPMVCVESPDEFDTYGFRLKEIAWSR